MRNIFLKKLYRKYGEESSPKLFSKKSRLSISLGQQSEILISCFIVCPNRGLPKYIETKVLLSWFCPV